MKINKYGHDSKLHFLYILMGKGQRYIINNGVNNSIQVLHKNKLDSQLNLTIMKQDIDKQFHKPDFQAKIVIIGDTNIGKTYICHQLAQKKYGTHDGTATIGLDMFKLQYKSADNETIAIQLWDTAGQQKYRSITKVYLKGTDVILFTFSLAHQSSFQDLCKWAELVQESVTARDILVVFIGNMIDLVKEGHEKYKLSQDKINKLRELSRSMDNEELKYFLISAKTGENMEKFRKQLFQITLKSKKKINALGNRPIYLPTSSSRLTSSNITQFQHNSKNKCC